MEGTNTSVSLPEFTECIIANGYSYNMGPLLNRSGVALRSWVASTLLLACSWMVSVFATTRRAWGAFVQT